MKTNGLPVIFRKWPESEGGGVIAIFPTDPGTQDPYTCGSYEHVGQHGSCEPVGLIQRTARATPAEYADLLKELHRIGYRNLVIYDRYQQSFLNMRRKELERMKAAWSGDREAKKTNYVYVNKKAGKATKRSAASGLRSTR